MRQKQKVTKVKKNNYDGGHVFAIRFFYAQSIQTNGTWNKLFRVLVRLETKQYKKKKCYKLIIIMKKNKVYIYFSSLKSRVKW